MCGCGSGRERWTWTHTRTLSWVRKKAVERTSERGGERERESTIDRLWVGD